MLIVAAVPTIDISSILTISTDNYIDEEYEITAKAIHDSLQNYGIFIATGHSLNDSQIQNNIKSMKELFSLTIEEKLSLQIGDTFRGYIGFGEESGLPDVFEPKEGYSYGYPNNITIFEHECSNASNHNNETKSKTFSKNLLLAENKWPSNFSKSNIDILHNTFLTKVFISKCLTRAIFKYRNESMVDSLISNGDRISILRLFHYFSSDVMQVNSSSEIINTSKILGSSPHTDWGLITLISADNITGLQFLNNNSWIDVPYVDGGLVVNGGDYLSLLSTADRNAFKHYGKLHSPIHRVLSQESERYSSVFFFYPDFDSKLQPVINTDTTSEHAIENNLRNQNEPQVAIESTVGVQFNTLLSSTNKPNFDTFGEYIMQKWQDVRRTNE
eukprot:gene13925-18674_t